MLYPNHEKQPTYFCPHCEWGKDKAMCLIDVLTSEHSKDASNSQYLMVPSYIRIISSLTISTALLAVPYIIMVKFWPYENAVPMAFHLAYWILATIYLAAAYFEDPRIHGDWDVWKLGNPIKSQPKKNIFTKAFSLLLTPGKLVVWSITALLVRLFK